MPISTPTLMCTAFNTLSGQSTATSADCPAGSLIVIGLAEWNTNNTTTGQATLADSAGNTYSQAILSVAATGFFGCSIYYCSNCLHLPSAGTITPTMTSGGRYGIAAAYVTGANGGLDKTNTVNTASTQTISVSTGALGNSSEIVFGFCNPSNSLGGLSEGNGFTSLAQLNSVDTDFAYLIVSASTSVTYNPTITAAANSLVADVATFQATATAGPVVVGLAAAEY